MRSTLTLRPCPTCGADLNGGPVHYTCTDGHGVNAADLNTEYHPQAVPR